jgi:hypothetical protein
MPLAQGSDDTEQKVRFSWFPCHSSFAFRLQAPGAVSKSHAGLMLHSARLADLAALVTSMRALTEKQQLVRDCMQRTGVHHSRFRCSRLAFFACRRSVGFVWTRWSRS